jgi:transcriptional regulator with XRE-family HTH domain
MGKAVDRHHGLQKIIADNVRLLRRQKGLSQEELADICGYHRTYVGMIERGERNMTVATLEALAVALKVAPERLIARERD